MEALYVGVDGGGTKTHVVCLGKDGDIRGESIKGSTNVNSVGQEIAFQNMKDAIEGAIQNANAKKEQVVGICLGMAGVDSPSDKADREKWIIQILPHRPLIDIYNDGVIALASGTSKLHGIVVISGTGCIVLGVKDGKQYRASGWGPLLGDEGSGFCLGQQAMKAVCNAEDGGPATLLTGLLLKELNLENVRSLIEWTYKDVTWARFAVLSNLVFEAAQQNDKVALEILHNNASALLSGIKLVHKKGGFSGKTPLVFAGGNLVHSNGTGIYAETLRALIQKHPDLELEILMPTLAAPVAAARLASQKSSL